MESARTKRNIVALAVAIPIIFLLAALTSSDNDHFTQLWRWINNIDTRDKEIVAMDRTLTRIVNLEGDWHFATGDDIERSYVDFDHSDWAQIKVPSYWETEGYRDYDGFGWYRKEFEIGEKALTKPLFAIMGRIDDVDEVYINGQKIGGLGQFPPPTYLSAWREYRQYPIPEGVLHGGRNIIAVRVYDAQMGGGIYNGDIGIYVSGLAQPLVNLQGEWQFKIDPDASYQKIQVPGKWEEQGFENYDGLAWYKKEFGALPVKGDQTLVLMLGKIDDTDEVHLNGTLIGRTGSLTDRDQEIDSKYYLIDRNYEFASSLLQESNILEVKVHDSYGPGGIYTGPVAIMTKADYLHYVETTARSN